MIVTATLKFYLLIILHFEVLVIQIKYIHMNKRTMNESRYQNQLENPQIKNEESTRSVQNTITNSRLVLRKKDLVNL